MFGKLTVSAALVATVAACAPRQDAQSVSADLWQQIHHPPQYLVDKDRCAAEAKNKAGPINQKDMEFVGFVGGTLENARSARLGTMERDCMIATGNYDFLKLSGPDWHEVARLRQEALEAARLGVAPPAQLHTYCLELAPGYAKCIQITGSQSPSRSKSPPLI